MAEAQVSDVLHRRDPSELSASELDDDADREELRHRYAMVMQELRVLLPGTQVLMAFLLTVPFAQRFDTLDDTGRHLFGVTLVATVLAVVSFLTPIAVHRFGERRQRSVRLRQAIVMMRIGIVGLATSLLAGLAVVTRLVFGGTVGAWIVGGAAVAMVLAWLAVPLATRASSSHEARIPGTISG